MSAFLYNSVLGRIEVKSTVDIDKIREFCKSSKEISELKLSAEKPFDGAFNTLFAYKSKEENNKDKDFELKRLIKVLKEQNIDPLSGIVSAICVVTKGFWKIGTRYLFNWNEVPGNDSGRLVEFLKQEFGISWVEAAKIEKIDDGRTIRVTDEKNYLSLGLNNEITKVNLKIDDGRSAELIVKSENGILSIYSKIWQRLDSDKSEDYITWFVSCASQSCFIQHVLRQGRDPKISLEGGIGKYLEEPYIDLDLKELIK